MRLPDFDFIKPIKLEKALNALHDYGKEAGILAGGTDLLVNMKYRVKRPKTVISIKSVPELRTISSDRKGVTNIGACVDLSELSENGFIAEHFTSFRHAIRSIASRHIRNMATIGGNLCLETRCWYYNQSEQWRAARMPCHKLRGNICHAIKGSKRCHAINSSDTAPILIALDAEVSLEKKGHKRTIPVREFYRDNGAKPNVVEPGEMLTSLLLPKQSRGSLSTFIKFATRKGLDFAEGNIAARGQQSGKNLTDVRLIIGSMASAPIVLKKASEIIAESGLTEHAIEKAAETVRTEMGTVTNLFTPAGYKRQMAEVLVKRALLDLKSRIK